MLLTSYYNKQIYLKITFKLHTVLLLNVHQQTFWNNAVLQPFHLYSGNPDTLKDGLYVKIVPDTRLLITAASLHIQ